MIGKTDRRGRLVWSLPKGHVEPGETLEMTAAREVEEETGIAGVVVSGLGTVDYWFVAEGRRSVAMEVSSHALVQERVAREELAHVRIATRWFQRWTGGCDFDEWLLRLPPPLSPLLLRGKPIARELRRRAGMPDDFISALADYVPETKGRSL